MNWLLIVVILFLLAYIYRGYHNGFIKTVFSIAAVGIALIVASVGSPMLSQTLQNNETIHSYIEDKVSKTIHVEAKETEKAEQEKIIDKLPLPESIRDALLDNNNADTYSSLATDTFGGYVSGYVTGMIFNALSYVLLFIITLIIVRIIANVLDLVSKLPIINSINHIGGLCVGAAHGLIILWVWCLVLTIFSGTNIGQVMFEQINGSEVLSLIYNNNLLLVALTNLAKALLVIH